MVKGIKRDGFSSIGLYICLGIVFILLISGIFIWVIAGNNNNTNNHRNNNNIRRRECCFTTECAANEDSSDCEVDIVIAGCGSAGSLMASRLSELRVGEKNYSVLCLEQGKYYNDEPAIKYVLQGSTFWLFVPSYLAKFSINQLTDPEPNLGGFSFTIQHAAMVGGSGNHDYTLIVYPSPNTTKIWETAGGTQWSYENVVALINSYEQFLGTPNSSCPHGLNGRIANLPTPAGTSAGVASYDFMKSIVASSPADNNITPFVSDQNCGSETSFSNTIQYFWRPLSEGVIARSSPGLDFLGLDVMSPAGFGIGKRRLRVLTETVVDKFHVDKESNRATYVSAIVHGQTRRFYARKQIITALNAIHSPGFLERSGIGDAARLTSLGIPVVHHSPGVGENLQQHLGSQVVFITNQTNDNYNFISSQGLLTIDPTLNHSRNVQFLVIPGPGFNIYNFHPATPVSLPLGFNSVSLIIALLTPRSRGSVHIETREPSRWPTIFTNGHSDPENIDFLLVNRSLTIVYQAILAMREANPQYEYRLTTPDESVFTSATKLADYIHLYPMNSAHWSSTCSVGSVIDGNLQLIGVEGVTVADTSSLSQISSGNTRTQALITGQYASDYLRATL